MGLLRRHRQGTRALHNTLVTLAVTASTHLAALVVHAGPGSQEDVSNDEVTLPASREQGRPHPAVNTIYIRPIKQQNLSTSSG